MTQVRGRIGYNTFSMQRLRRWFYSVLYYFNPPWDTGISPPELMAYIESNPPGRALDLGCGTGTNVITLARRGWDVTGVDFVPRAIRKARQKAHAANIQANLFVGDVTRLDGALGPFDLILDMGCFHSLSSQGKHAYVDSLKSLLAPGGTYLLYVFFKEPDQSGPGLLERELDLLSASLELKFRKDGTERGIRPSAWLTYHLRV